MGEVIVKKKTKTAGCTVEGFGPWLDVFEMNEGRRSRNKVVTDSLAAAGQAWAAKFLGRRFTNYVRGAPFFYSMGVEGAVKKFRRMGLLKPILDKEFYGWDPWSNASPPFELINDYRRLNPEARGSFSRSGNFLTATRTIRRESKEIVRDFVGDLMKSKTRPLVETGGAEKAALAGYSVKAAASKGRARLTIGVPFGGPRNPLVGKIVRTMPSSEVGFIAKTWQTIISRFLRGTGLQAFTRGNHSLAPEVG